MYAPNLKLLIAGGLLTLNLASQAAPAYQSAQDADHPLACCLASEWTLTAPAGNQGPIQAQATQAAANAESGAARCQTELGDLSCCIGSEWVLGQSEPANRSSQPEAAPAAAASEEFCCLASEYFVH